MNRLDRFIGYFFPSVAYKRQAWRQVNEQTRFYDAGGYGRFNAGWSGINLSAESTDVANRDTIRARARDAERNMDIANATIRAFERNVIGAGYILQAETGNPDLDEQIESLWKQWCKKSNCDVTGTQSFTQLMRMAVRRKKVDGGILFVKAYTNGGVLPLKIQALEVDELDTSRMEPHNKSHSVVGGIEYDSFRKPRGYWIRQYSLDNWQNIEPVYIKAHNVIFYWSRHRPSQLREMSDFAPTISRFRDLNEFMEAVSVKERVAACLAVFIKRIVPSMGVGRSQSRQEAAHHDYDGKKIVPGMIRELNAGDEIQVVNPAGQAADANEFVKLQQCMTASGQGLSYEAVSRDMSRTNYSSARQGAIEDDLTYQEEREQLIDVMDDIYASFIRCAILAGKISAADIEDDKYYSHSWVQANKPWVDPAKEATALQTSIQLGQKTFQQACAESGHDWKQQIDDIAEAMEYAELKGVTLGGVFGNGDKRESKPGSA